MPGARDQKSWDAGLGGTKRDGCGTNPCGCCGSCVAPPRARPPPRRIARFRSLRHKLAAWLDGTPQTGASVTDGPRRGSPASPCGPGVGRTVWGSRLVEWPVCARESASRLSRKIPEDPGIKTSDRVHRGRVPALKGLPKGRQTTIFQGVKTRPPPLENRRMGGETPTKSLEPPSAVGATKKPSKHRGLSRIRPALSHLVPHPKTFGRAQEVQTGRVAWTAPTEAGYRGGSHFA